MTPEQLHNNLFLLVTVGGAFSLETAALIFAPRLLAFAAYVPVSTRRVPLSGDARVLLSARDERATYRSVGLAGIDWTRLPGAHRFDAMGARAELDPAVARVVLRLPFQPTWFAFSGVTVVRLRVEGDSVVFTTRALPWLALTSAAFFASLLCLVAAGGPWSVGAAFVGLFAVCNALSAYRVRTYAAALATSVVDTVAGRLNNSPRQGVR